MLRVIDEPDAPDWACSLAEKLEGRTIRELDLRPHGEKTDQAHRHPVNGEAITISFFGVDLGKKTNGQIRGGRRGTRRHPR